MARMEYGKWGTKPANRERAFLQAFLDQNLITTTNIDVAWNSPHFHK